MISHRDNILTILICCYNAEEVLKKCLDSLMHQSILSLFYKVFFINDASTDNSFELAKRYSNNFNNFAILNNKRNEGLVECLNKAIKRIKTPYFVRLDADDWLSSDAVEKILKEFDFLNKKNFIVFNRWDIRNKKLIKVNCSDDIYTWIGAGSVFNTENVRSVGGYSNEHWEEYDLYVKLLESGNKYKISPHRIYHYRRGHESVTKDYEKNKQGFESLLRKWGLKVLRKYGDFEKILEYYGI